MLAVGVSLKAWRSQHQVSKIKSVEQYWTETGIGSASLRDLIDDQTCASSERYFLACANAVMSVASRYNMQLQLDGTLTSVQKESRIALSEKQLLEPWKRYYSEHTEVAQKISFTAIWETLAKKFISEKQKSLMVGLGLNGFISVFRDPHTYLMPIAYYRDVISKSDNKTSSLGIILGRAENHYFIRKIYPGAPAEKSGLRKGDWLVEIEGQPVSALLPGRVSEMMRGEVGRTVHLTVEREGAREKIDVTHEQSTMPTVSVRLLDGIKPVGLLTINKFSHLTCERTKEAVKVLMAQNIRGLLLDLRDNPGGQMEEAACVASLFVGPDQKIFEIRYLNPARDSETVYGPEAQLYKGPMAILINSGSASAAEIVAGALRDLNRAALVGERSFGKGSFQEGEVWEQNKKIALFETKGFYYLPSGRSPQAKGLEPDIKIVFKDTLQTREADQFINPLHAPERTRVARGVMKFSFAKCLDAEDGSGVSEDPEVGQARQALFCINTSVAGVAQ